MLYAAKHLFGDFLTAIVFVAVYASTGNLPLAVGATIATAIGQIAFAWTRGRKLDAMVWLSLFLAIAFGGASLLSSDPRFVMAKPSVIHAAIAIAMLRRGWLGRYMDDRSRARIPDRTVVAVGYGWALFMFALAAANLVVAFTMPFAAWAWFVSVGLLVAKALGFLVTFLVLKTAAKRAGRAASGERYAPTPSPRRA